MGLGDSRNGRKRDERTRVEGRVKGNEGPRAKASKDMCHGKKKQWNEENSIRLYERGALYLTRRPKLIYCLLRNMAVTSLLRINSLFLFFHLESTSIGENGERRSVTKNWRKLLSLFLPFVSSSPRIDWNRYDRTMFVRQLSAGIKFSPIIR